MTVDGRRPPRALLALGAACGLALAVAGCALWLTVRALEALKAQSRIELAMSLRRQFDTDYLNDRADVAGAFLYRDRLRDRQRPKGAKKPTGLESSPYDYVVDFFDALGYLVERGAVDEEMARRYFKHPLLHYFAATERLLRRDEAKRPGRYKHVFRLMDRWNSPAPGEPQLDLDAFFEDELDFAEPPAEEGPRT